MSIKIYRKPSASGAGDVTKVGTPVNNQVGVWTGNGTIEGTTGFTYDGANLLLTGDIGATGTRITKGWFTDLQVTNSIAASITGSAATLTTTRTIWGQNFNGSANVTGDITLGTGNITLTGSIGATGARATKVWATDIESTNAPTVGGTAVLVSGGALGTPSSGTVTNLTGTASININGTVGATTPTTGVFTTLVAGSTTSLLLGTAGSAVGNIGFRNATSGTITLAPVTGALGTVTLTLPAITDTLAALTATQTFTNKTLQGAAITGALTGTGAYIPVTLLNSGTSASSSTFWRGDGTWAAPAGGGGAWTFVATGTYSVSVSSLTTLFTISSLDGDTVGVYKLIFIGDGPAPGTAQGTLTLRFNADTGSNYGYQNFGYRNDVLVKSNASGAAYMPMAGSGNPASGALDMAQYSGEIMIKSTKTVAGNRRWAQGQVTTAQADYPTPMTFAGNWTNSANNLTSITVSAAIDSGTSTFSGKYWIYKIVNS